MRGFCLAFAGLVLAWGRGDTGVRHRCVLPCSCRAQAGVFAGRVCLWAHWEADGGGRRRGDVVWPCIIVDGHTRGRAVISQRARQKEP
ncbi:hypothetical protein FB451DRAFT_1266854 [Mycena latifolia]|nr:hypothetical protein FB451DRAFT_1293993 [Mycena latifolia]KAJ7462459.1 hypothetical protein FB451DRAFT_1266854 [Mycena latifolia]